MHYKPILPALLFGALSTFFLPACLPPSVPYPNRPPAEVVAEAEAWSGN